MNSPFEKIDTQLVELAPLFQRALGSQAEVTLADLHTRSQEQRLNVLVFGAYNAGKSTLINALLGRDEARVGDIPTTDRIDRYDWNGHVLLDSPGVNAPIEHERATQAEIERSDLILCVISDEDQDVQDVYVRLLDLVKSGKKVFLVINPRSTDADDVARVLDRTNSLLLASANSANVSSAILEELPVITVNADSAMRARLGNKPALLTHSGYEAFLVTFGNWLQRYKGEQQRLAAYCQQVEGRLVTPALTAIESHIGNDANKKLDEATRAMAGIETSSNLLHLAARNQVTRAVNIQRGPLRAAVEAAMAGESVEDRIVSACTDAARQVEEWLTSDIKSGGSLVLESSLDWQQLASELQGGAGKDGGAGLARQAVEFAKGVDHTLIPKTLANLKWLQPFLKSSREWLKRFGPLIRGLAAVFEVFLAQNQQARQNEMEQRRALHCHQQAGALAEQLEQSLAEQVDTVVTSLFADDLARLRRHQDELRSGLSALAADRETLLDLRLMLSKHIMPATDA
ncbi:MAG: GTP-binding protein HSR1-related protein [Moraxellaceae bacterium]|nr:GTP-binding protein HSR1-related protein [Moraxellaceae bacterium]